MDYELCDCKYIKPTATPRPSSMDAIHYLLFNQKEEGYWRYDKTLHRIVRRSQPRGCLDTSDLATTQEVVFFFESQHGQNLLESYYSIHNSVITLDLPKAKQWLKTQNCPLTQH